MAISVDPPETTREHLAKTGWTFTFLSDPKAEVIRRYDLLHPGGGQGAEALEGKLEELVRRQVIRGYERNMSETHGTMSSWPS